MNVLISIKSHVSHPHSGEFPRNSIQDKNGYRTFRISRNYRILSLALSLGVATLAFRRYNLLGSTALGAITFFATTGVCKIRRIHEINNIITELQEKKKLRKAQEDERSESDDDSDQGGIVAVPFSTVSPTTKATAQDNKSDKWDEEFAIKKFKSYLSEQKINTPDLSLFLTDNIKKTMVEKLNDIQTKHQGREDLCRSFFSELKDLYEKYADDIPEEFEISVKTQNIGTFKFEISSETTIKQLRVLIFVQTGIHPDQQRPIFGGTGLKDSEGQQEKTVTDYKIKKDVVIHLALHATNNYWEYEKIANK